MSFACNFSHVTRTSAEFVEFFENDLKFYYFLEEYIVVIIIIRVGHKQYT